MVDIPDYVGILQRDGERAAGAFTRYLKIPCAVPPAVYVEAAIPAIIHAITDIISPDPKEIYHKAFGNSLFHDVKKVIKSSQLVEQLSDNPVGRALWRLGGLADLATWQVFIFSAAIDGLIDYAGQLQTMAECKNPGSLFFWQGSNYIDAIGDDGQFYGVDFSWTGGGGGAKFAPAGFSVTKNQNGFCAATTSWVDFGGAVVGASGAVIESEHAMVMDISSYSATAAIKDQKMHNWYQSGENALGRSTYEYMAATSDSGLPLGEAFGKDGTFSAFMLDLNS